jgi:signal transduction histidine kinase
MHRHGWWQALLVLACVLLIALISGGQWSFLQILLVVPAYLIGRRWAAVQPVLLGFGLGIVGQLVIWFLGEPADYLSQWFTSVLSDFVFLLLPWWLGRTLQQRETRRRQEAAVIADLARARERTRIAEDMHDLIGHDLALIAVHSGALEVLPGASEEQRQAAADIRSRAVSATDRLHECLGILRAEDPVDRRAPVGLDLESVVSAARDAGVSVDVEVTGEVPSEVAAPAVERIVQEALTNAMKHASGAPVTIRVSADRETAEVSVDNPRPKTAPASTGQPREAAPANSGSGMGLIAAEERVSLARRDVLGRPSSRRLPRPGESAAGGRDRGVSRAGARRRPMLVSTRKHATGSASSGIDSVSMCVVPLSSPGCVRWCWWVCSSSCST